MSILPSTIKLFGVENGKNNIIQCLWLQENKSFKKQVHVDSRSFGILQTK